MKPTLALRSFLYGSTLLAATPMLHATAFYWDGGIVAGGNPAADANGGTGTWNTSLTNWDTLAAAGADTAWTNGNQAVFAGTAGTVTLGAAITVSGNAATSGAAAMYFTTSGYIVGGTNSITTTADSTFRLNNTTFQSGVTIAMGASNPLILNITGTTNSIAGVISGSGSSGLDIGGAGTLTLSNTANTYTGLTIIGNNTNDITLKVTKLANLSQVSSLGAPTTATNGVIQIGDTSRNGTLELVGGTTASVTDRQVRIGSNSSGGGDATILNNNTDAAHSLVFTNAAFNLSNATNSFNRSLTLGGSNTGANEIQGAIINNANLVSVNVSGTGAWRLSGNNTYDGATTVSGNATLTLSGNNSGAAGGVTLSTAVASNGPRLNLNSANALGTGTLNFGGGLASDTVRLDNTSAGLVTVGTNNAFTLNRNFTFIGTQSLDLGNMTTTIGGITAPGARNITVTNNTLTFGGSIGETVAGLGINKLGAGTLAIKGTSSFTGSTTVSAGVLALDNNLALQNSALVTTGAGSLTIGAGVTTPTLGGLSGATGNLATIITSGYNLVTGLTLNPLSGSVTYGGQIADGATGMTLTKSGGGTQVLSGTNTYTGDTTVSAGVLAVNGSLANTSTSVGNLATLQGSGTIAGSVTVQNGGTLASGNSIESLGVGNLNLAAGSIFAYELQTNLYAGTPNLAGDLTDSTGTLDITAGAILTLTDLATSTALALNSKFTLISYFGGWTIGELFSYDAGAGLTTLADNSTFTLGANTWEFNYDDTTGGPNFSLDQNGATHFVTMTVVPEPSAALLGGLGLLVLLRRRRA